MIKPINTPLSYAQRLAEYRRERARFERDCEDDAINGVRTREG